MRESNKNFPYRVTVPSGFRHSDTQNEQNRWCNEVAGKGNWRSKTADRSGQRKMLFKDEDIALQFKLVFGGHTTIQD